MNNKDWQELLVKIERETSKEIDSKTLGKEEEELEKLRLENVHSSIKNDLRIKIFYWVKLTVSIYLSLIGVIIFVLLFGLGELDTNVTIALLTTSTINVLGLPWLIINSLYSEDKNNKK